MLRSAQKAHNRTQLRVEALEDRWCPSTTVLFDDATNTLTITGDGAANRVRVIHDDDANEVRVRHDGITHTFTSSGIDKIVVRLQGGNDSFTQTLQEGTNFSRPKTLDVRTGAGQDRVMFDLAGNANYFAILKENLTIDLRTGGAADTVQINLPTVEIANELRLTALLGRGADRFDAIAFGDVGTDGILTLDVRAEAGNDGLFYFGTYNAKASAFGIDVKAQALLSILLDGGAGRDRLDATYAGEVDGLCSFYLHGDLETAGADRDRVSLHMTTQADSTGEIYGFVLGSRGNDLLSLLGETEGPTSKHFVADGGGGFDTCISTSGVQVSHCEA